jgi:HEAT repeats
MVIAMSNKPIESESSAYRKKSSSLLSNLYGAVLGAIGGGVGGAAFIIAITRPGGFHDDVTEGAIVVGCMCVGAGTGLAAMVAVIQLLRWLVTKRRLERSETMRSYRDESQKNYVTGQLEKRILGVRESIQSGQLEKRILGVRESIQSPAQADTNQSKDKIWGRGYLLLGPDSPMKNRILWVFGLFVILVIAVAVSPLRYVVRGWLAGESFQSGWPTSYWVDSLADQNPENRQRATSALAQGGPASEQAIPALITALGDSNAEVRWGAAHALGEIGRRAEQVVPALVKLLSSRSTSDRIWAATGIGLFGHDAKGAVPELVDRLDDRSPQVRNLVAWALGRIGPDARSGVPKLMETVEDNDPVESEPFVKTVGEMARAALWQIDPAAARKAGILPVYFPWDRFGKDRGR